MFFPGFVTLDCHEKKVSSRASNLAFQKIRENEKFMIIKTFLGYTHACHALRTIPGSRILPETGSLSNSVLTPIPGVHKCSIINVFIFNS